MKALLAFIRFMDFVSERVGKIAAWLVLLSCLISAGNAMVRYSLDTSSNAWLEIQWYMFAGIVVLGAATALERNEHVRVDVIYGRLAPRTCVWIDLLGALFFLLPAAILLAWMSWPLFVDSYRTGEMSTNAGGLIRWPFKILLPAGFGLLALQGIAEVIKRVLWLLGKYDMDTHYERPVQ